MVSPRVSDVMTAKPVTVTADTSFRAAAELLTKHQISALPVVGERGEPLGVVSEADLLAKQAWLPGLRFPGMFAGATRWARWRKTTARSVGEVMTTPVHDIKPDAPLALAARRLIEGNLRRLLVVDDFGHLVGVLARRDLLRAFVRGDEEIAETVHAQVSPRLLPGEQGSLSVRVIDGEVILDGQLARESDIELAGHLAALVPGVVGVTNNIHATNAST